MFLLLNPLILVIKNSNKTPSKELIVLLRQHKVRIKFNFHGFILGMMWSNWKELFCNWEKFRKKAQESFIRNFFYKISTRIKIIVKRIKIKVTSMRVGQLLNPVGSVHLKVELSSPFSCTILHQ